MCTTDGNITLSSSWIGLKLLLCGFLLHYKAHIYYVLRWPIFTKGWSMVLPSLSWLRELFLKGFKNDLKVHCFNNVSTKKSITGESIRDFFWMSEENIYSMLYHCTKTVFPFSISSFKINIRDALKDIKLLS